MKTNLIRKTAANFAAAVVLALAVAPCAMAQTFPNKPLGIVAPFPPGSGTDHAARIMAQAMGELLKQPIVVENRTGANGIIGMEYAKRATADPYTMVLTASTTHAANISMYKKLPYDPVKDFTPIARIGAIAFVLMVRPSFPANNVGEFVAYARKIPGKLSFGHGSAGMLASATLFSKIGGLTAQPIPYKGNPPALADLLGGQIDFSFVDTGNAIAQLKGGKLKALAITMPQRSALAPEIPTFAEGGVAGVEVQAWIGLLTAAGIPEDTRQKLIDAATTALNRQDVKVRLMAVGFDVDPADGDGFSQTIDTDIKHWAQMLKDAGVQPE